MRKLKVIIEYDGTNFRGFQVQPGLRTVQGELEKAIAQLTKTETKIIGAGRTDAGVHALGQVVSFSTASTIPIERFSIALNSCLPADLRVRSAEEVAEDFHARFSARWKTYRYLIRTDPKGAVFWRNYSLLLPFTLDIGAMQAAAQHLIGTHSFQAFCASGAEVRNFVRTVVSCRIRMVDANLIIEVTADGFLYHMVRNMVGTLLQVGRGERSAGDIPGILASLDRNQAGPTAPPQGLYLVKVGY